MKFALKKSAVKADKSVRAGRAPSKNKAFKAARGSKYILFLGDEGAILVHLKDSAVLSRQFVPDASQPNLDELKRELSANPKVPIMLVIDNMDQSFVQQTLPPVSSMSVGKLIKRRLDRDFGANDIKGAIVLGREQTGRKDWNFLMISLERSPQLAVWLDFVNALPNRFAGIHLVSVEAQEIVKTLERALDIPKEGTGAEWKFFVSHNKVGGFRQVILRKGQIIFTRLAQPLAEADVEVIAGNIEQEMQGTIEYMKRLSFTPQAGLDIYILASAGIKDAIDVSKFGASSAQVITPFEMAQYFTIEGATQPTDQFGDVVLAAIIGGSKKHVLKLSVPQYSKQEGYYKIVTYQRALAAASVVGIVGYAGYIGLDMLSLYDDASDLQVKKGNEERGLAALKAEIVRSNLNVEKATDLIDLYKQLQLEGVHPLGFIEQLRAAVISPIALKSIEWTLEKDGAVPLASAAPPAAGGSPVAAPNAKPLGKMTAKVTLELPEIAANKKASFAVANKVQGDFNAAFPGYAIRITAQPVAANDVDKLQEAIEDASKKEEKPKTAEAVKTPEMTLEIQGFVYDEAPVLTQVAAPTASPSPAVQPITSTPQP